MRVLVTGATGFLGGAVARRLQATGHEVLGTGRDLSAGQRLVHEGIRFEPADIRQAEAVGELCGEQDVVIHCAALSSPWGPATELHAINVDGTRHVVDACRARGVKRLVHISTPGIYVGLGDRLLVQEDAALPPKPANSYVRTKLAAEAIVTKAHAAGLESVILRPRGIYGPGDTVVLPRLIRALEVGRLPRIGNPKTVMDLTYIDNAVDGVALALAAGEKALGRAYNLTDGSPVELWPLVDQLCGMLDLPEPTKSVPYGVVRAYAFGLEWIHKTIRRGSEPMMTTYTAELLARSLTLDISAAKQELGYAPKVLPEEGVRRFAEWWRAKP